MKTKSPAYRCHVERLLGMLKPISKVKFKNYANDNCNKLGTNKDSRFQNP